MGFSHGNKPSSYGGFHGIFHCKPFSIVNHSHVLQNDPTRPTVVARQILHVMLTTSKVTPKKSHASKVSHRGCDELLKQHPIDKGDLPRFAYSKSWFYISSRHIKNMHVSQKEYTSGPNSRLYHDFCVKTTGLFFFSSFKQAHVQFGDVKNSMVAPYDLSTKWLVYGPVEKMYGIGSNT